MRSFLRWTVLLAATSVALGFVLFAVDEIDKESGNQVAAVDESQAAGAAAGELAREHSNGALRELVDDANDVLLRPFDGIVPSDDAWVSRGVPTALGLLVYGLGGILILNYTLPSRR